MLLTGMIVGTTIIAAVSDGEWARFQQNISEGFGAIHKKLDTFAANLATVMTDQAVLKFRVDQIADRVKNIDDEQQRYRRAAERNVAVMAPPLVADTGSAKWNTVIGLGAIVAFLATIGYGASTAIKWLAAHLPQSKP